MEPSLLISSQVTEPPATPPEVQGGPDKQDPKSVHASILNPTKSQYVPLEID